MVLALKSTRCIRVRDVIGHKRGVTAELTDTRYPYIVMT